MGSFVEKTGHVYWIHLPEHKNIKSDGYIGITNSTVAKRFREHSFHSKKDAKYPIYRAIKKYGDKLIVDTVFSGEYERCIEIEKHFRPNPDIGWNLRVGGCVGNSWSESSRKKASKSAKIRGISDKCRIAHAEGVNYRVGSKASRAKVANIYDLHGNIIAKEVCIAEWCRSVGKENMELKLTCTANENNRAKTTHGIYAKYINQNKVA